MQEEGRPFPTVSGSCNISARPPKNPLEVCKGVDEPMASAFPPTRHSVIERLRQEDAAQRSAAFGDLVEGYWKPVYKHLRTTWRLSAEDAQDLTQAFFSDAFQKAWLEKYEPGKARFRTFVRVCVDRFAMNARQASSRLKRGGDTSTLSLDFEGAEVEIRVQTQASRPDAEDFFRQEFVRALFQRAVAASKLEMEGSGRALHFALFERYDLDPAEGVSYGSLAAAHGLTESQVTNYLALVRRTFRAHALHVLRGLCATDEEFRREARELFGMEVE
jgi:DNA-directed RNA polymerase specialized sigma24 family protein